jgi:hypothetical protein
MTDKQIIDILINGGTVSILDNSQFCRVRNELRKIKNNCTTVLSQMKNQ